MKKKPKQDMATQIILRQLAADSMVDMVPMRGYGPSEVQHLEDTRRRAQAALQVYIDHGYEIPTPYRMGSAIIVGNDKR